MSKRCENIQLQYFRETIAEARNNANFKYWKFLILYKYNIKDRVDLELNFSKKDEKSI